MGAEAYGLVALFGTLQVWFSMLDIGLSPTISRETAKFRAGTTSRQEISNLMRCVEALFSAVAILGVVSLMLGSGKITNDWLKTAEIGKAEVQYSVCLMSIIVGLRWMSGLQRGAVIGLEEIRWLSVFSAILATARFILVIPVLKYVNPRPIEFFSFQLLVSAVEFVLLYQKTHRAISRVGVAQENEKGKYQWNKLRSLLGFSTSIAFTNIIWIVVSQTDRLLLSKLISLREYAYFSLGVLIASAVSVVSGPINTVLLPRLTNLNAQGNEAAFLSYYRQATQFVCALAVPAAATLALFPEQTLWMWTGNREIASQAGPTLSLYAIGNGVLALSAFPYYLQYAKGDVRLHVIGNALFVILFIPLLLFLVRAHGVQGAGLAWLIANIIPFLFWLPVVHRRFYKEFHMRWLIEDVIAVAAPGISMGLLIRQLLPWPESRLATFMWLAVVFLMVAGAGTCGTRKLRMYLGLVLRKHFKISA